MIYDTYRMKKNTNFRILQRVGNEAISFKSNDNLNTLNASCLSKLEKSDTISNRLYTFIKKLKLSNGLMHLLPQGYPHSVASGYDKYIRWQALSMMLSSAGGVLSTQALLVSLGLGSAAAPMAGTLNWVIKDGLGQIGRCINIVHAL